MFLGDIAALLEPPAKGLLVALSKKPLLLFGLWCKSETDNALCIESSIGDNELEGFTWDEATAAAAADECNAINVSGETIFPIEDCCCKNAAVVATAKLACENEFLSKTINIKWF